MVILRKQYLPQTLFLLFQDCRHCVEQALVLTACFFHNDFRVCSNYVLANIFCAHLTLLPCQALAEKVGILTPVSFSSLAVTYHGREQRPLIFTKYLFHAPCTEQEMNAVIMVPGSCCLWWALLVLDCCLAGEILHGKEWNLGWRERVLMLSFVPDTEISLRWVLFAFR